MGPLEVEVDSERVAIDGVKQRTLLAMLLANRNSSVAVGILIEVLWGGNPPKTAAKSIQKYVSQLRKHLADSIETTSDGYRLTVGDDEVDAGRFEHAASRADELSESEVEQALDLWRGDPYPELASSGAGAPEITRLGEEKLTLQERLVDILLDQGKHASTIGLINELATANPYRERFWGQLMLALYRSGRQSDALAVFQRVRRVLGEQLGIEPSSELQLLEERILLQDPALELARRPPSNLSVSLTSFVGRAEEMSHLRSLLSSARLVTVLGPAGSGKTRLATEIGWYLGERFAGGAWFVDLAPIRSPDGVVEAIAKPLGVAGSAGRATESVLTDHLSRLDALLILDNCEHLVARVAEIAEGLLRSAAELVVLATSRERLGVGGEVVFDLHPLPYPAEGEDDDGGFDAVELFEDRAAASHYEYRPGAEPSLVGEIVRRLDGMPLAIELAAARVRSLGLRELRDRLDDKFNVLKSQTRGVIDRHQTLLGAIDWSYRLLEPEERDLFSRLSVFRGTFTLDAAGHVCAHSRLAEDRVVDLLSELVDKSLVTATEGGWGERRYYLLEMLREYGRRQLGREDTTHLRSRHADYYCRFAETAARHLNGPDQARWFQALSADHDNMRKALQWASTIDSTLAVRMAIALSPFWDSVGPRSEGHEWLRRAVELSAELDPRLRLRALLEASMLFSSDHASLPVAFAEHALDLAREIGESIGEGRALRALSWAHALEEDNDLAIGLGLEAKQIFESLGEDWELAHTLERLGQAQMADSAASIEMLDRALDLYRGLGDRTREALTLFKLADRLAGSGGDLQQARAYAERSIEICDEVGNRTDAAHARLEYGKILRRAGNFAAAIAALSGALEQLTKTGDERCSVRALTALGLAHIGAGDLEDARDVLGQSLRRGRDIEEWHTVRAGIGGLATLTAETGDPEAAVVFFAFATHAGSELGVAVSEASAERRRSLADSLRHRLGTRSFEEAWARGAGLDPYRAVDLALDTLRSGWWTEAR